MEEIPGLDLRWFFAAADSKMRPGAHASSSSVLQRATVAWRSAVNSLWFLSPLSVIEKATEYMWGELCGSEPVSLGPELLFGMSLYSQPFASH